jgi:excisionase family DNA binding protein
VTTLSVSEAASLVNRSESTIRAWISDDRLPAVKNRWGAWEIRRADVLRCAKVMPPPGNPNWRPR